MDMKTTSVCWDCKRAYADQCFAIPFVRRNWVKEYKKLIRKTGEIDALGQETTYTMYRVFKCERFLADWSIKEV